MTTKREQKAQDKLSRIPVKINYSKPIPKPPWIRIKLSSSDKINELKKNFRNKNLHTVCEEAACPNLIECFQQRKATFMIMGSICTRRCAFCDVDHGKPLSLDSNEPKNLAQSIYDMNLKYVVITSVDRDDLKDGGGEHFSKCIKEVRRVNHGIKIEILVPDFRKREEKALKFLIEEPCDIFNHNLETIPRLYKQIRSGASYEGSLKLLNRHKEIMPHIPTKSGLMLGLGETLDEIKVVMKDLKKHNVDMITLGQYLQPTKHHAPVIRYVHPDEFKELEVYGYEIGFSHVASGPLVRSSYHADQQSNSLL